MDPGENSNGRGTEPVFQVKRRSKKGEALQLSLSHISPLFSLRLSNAAQELGISTSSLKKACRHIGLHRWPGRKVRGLESTIDGLQRNSVGQGSDLGVLGEASMPSEIPTLQQELHELCHGTLAQITEKMHSQVDITKGAYRRLYTMCGWRSEHHNLVRHDINAGDQANLTPGLAPASAHENNTGADLAAKLKKPPERKQKLAPCTDFNPPANQPTPNADKESARPSPRKNIRPSSRRILRSTKSRLGSRDTEMKPSDLEGLLPEVHDILNVARREVPESVVQAQNGNMTSQEVLLTPKTEIGEEWSGDGKVCVEEEGAAVDERSREHSEMMLRCAKCGKWIRVIKWYGKGYYDM